MKTKLLAQTGWRGQLNDRVLSPAFPTLEDAHSLPLTPIAVLSAAFDTLVTLHIMGLLVMQSYVAD
jgi:hypothetical protein